MMLLSEGAYLTQMSVAIGILKLFLFDCKIMLKVIPWINQL